MINTTWANPGQQYHNINPNNNNNINQNIGAYNHANNTYNI